jgi:ferritin
MLDKKIYDLINDQINKELYSAYLYVDFSFYFGGKGLSGFASWYMKQAKEEVEHAEKFIKYIHDNGMKVELLAIDKPDKKLNDDMSVLKMGLEHEQYVTSLINKIYDAAFEIKDYKTMGFLDWFVKEQIEEEANAEELISKYELYAGCEAGLYSLNKELGKREGC